MCKTYISPETVGYTHSYENCHFEKHNNLSTCAKINILTFAYQSIRYVKPFFTYNGEKKVDHLLYGQIGVNGSK